mgnify:CR=1 FL=1
MFQIEHHDSKSCCSAGRESVTGHIPENFLDGLGNLPEDNLRARTSFTFYPGMSHVSESASPLTLNRNHEINIPVEIDEDDEGVLLALGNHKSGYTFYVKDSKLHYEYNRGDQRFTISSDAELEKGAHDIKFEFENSGENQGTAKLFIDDEPVGETDVETLPFKTSFEGLDVGQDKLYPVSPEYEDEGDFAFTGEIEYVNFEFEEAEYIISEEVKQ